MLNKDKIEQAIDFLDEMELFQHQYKRMSECPLKEPKGGDAYY